jgi:hypothetical protein
MDVMIHVSFTLALVEGDWWSLLPGRSTSGEEPHVPIMWAAGLVPQPVWTMWRSFLTLWGLELGISVVQPSIVASRYNGHTILTVKEKNNTQNEVKSSV